MEEKPASMEEKAKTPPVKKPGVEVTTSSFWQKLKANKSKILGGFLGVLIFTGAVFGAYKLGQRQIQPAPTPSPTPVMVETPTPEPMETGIPQPSPTPVVIEKIPYKPIASWQTYTDSQAKYSVQYPESYKLASSNPGKEVIFWSCFSDPQKGEVCMSGYMIRVYEDYDGGSRRAWFERLRPNFLIDPYYEDVIVADIKTLIIMDGNVGGSTGSFVLIPKGNKMFLFEFPGGWNPDTKEKPGLDFIKQVLSTFRFLE